MQFILYDNDNISNNYRENGSTDFTNFRDLLND